jgi:hypothetical protein
MVLELGIALCVVPMSLQQNSFLFVFVLFPRVCFFPEAFMNDEQEQHDKDSQDVKSQGSDEEPIGSPFIRVSNT